MICRKVFKDMDTSYKDRILLEDYFPFAIQNQHLPEGFNMGKRFHWHKCLEISYVKSGRGKYYIEDRVYDMTAGDIIIINNIEPHYLEVLEEMHQSVIVFEPSLALSAPGMLSGYDYLYPFFERGTDFNNRLEKENPLYQNILQNILEMEEEYNSRFEGYTLIIRAKLLTILAYLIRYFRDAPKMDHSRRLNIKRVEEAMDYIKENFCDTITLKQAAEKAFLSPQYFSAVFKSVTGMTFIEYVNKVRIEKAIRLLSQSDLTVTQIAMECGFNNTVNFNMVFKKYTNRTPSTFKRYDGTSVNHT